MKKISLRDSASILNRIAFVISIYFILSQIVHSDVEAFTSYTVQFGGVRGYSYFPNTLNVHVFDTIKFVGPFHDFPINSTSLPSGVLPIGPDSTGDTLRYVVTREGEYYYQNNRYAAIGMTGMFTATYQLYGLSNEGRDFFLGMLYPSYNTIATQLSGADFQVFALVNSHYENDVFVSYYDNAGEGFPVKYHVVAGNALQIPLDIRKLQVDTSLDGASYKSCHITSTLPISVYYMSVGTNSGGSYLALPVLSLGKNYVAASYNDNPGEGSALGAGQFLPVNFEYAGGEFLIIGTEAATSVKITPMTTTVTGHPGVNTGKPHPFTIQLGRGQCYLVRSDGREFDNDMSASLIEASHPVAVISGHEDAFLGGVDGGLNDSRDLMIEQMVPIEYWDSAGYVAIPLPAGSPPGVDGIGDTYRIYSYDATLVKAHLDIQGISGGFDMPTQRLSVPPSQLDVAVPVEAYSTNGKRIQLMQYDERSAPGTPPWPAPSMVTIIPVSRWKNVYSFGVASQEDQVSNQVCLSVLALDFSKIKVSMNGAAAIPLSSLSRIGSFSNVSGHYPGLKGSQYLFTSGKNTTSYSLTSSDPFMVYCSGMRCYQASGGSALGTLDNTNFFQEFSSPAGMQLNTGISPSFVIDTQLMCGGWHVCIRDTGTRDPGIKSIALLNDPDGIYWNTPAKSKNVTFDQNSPDLIAGELNPNWHTNEKYCFDVSFKTATSAASAPLAIVDNFGNAMILRLDRAAPTISFSTSPSLSARPDSIVLPTGKIGEQICTTFTLKNTASKVGNAVALNSVLLSKSDPTYSFTATRSFPTLLYPGDSVNILVCYTAIDSLRHQDTLILNTDCFALTSTLDAHGSTGLIFANDLDFKSVTEGDSICKAVQITNVGSSPFRITGAVLSDSINFTVISSSFPRKLDAGASAYIQVCFQPLKAGDYSASIIWKNDLEESFKHSVKDQTVIVGKAAPKAGVADQTTALKIIISPNPADGKTLTVSLTDAVGGELSICDIMGREVSRVKIPEGVHQVHIPILSVSNGTYYLRMRDSAHGLVSQPFMIRR
ncbi:MAG: choice-of-anchor D domain-containing protein [bacterium]